MSKQKQINRSYVAPKVMSVSFNVEVGFVASAGTSNFGSEITLLGDPTSSSSPNAADGGSSTQQFFEYNW